MITEQNIPQPAAATGRSRDLLSKLYREIGISAVVAALEATAHKPQKRVHNRRTFPLCSGTTKLCEESGGDHPR